VLEHVKDYLRLLEEKKLKLTHVIDTHTHADHISGAAALKDLTGCEYGMHTRAPARCVTLRVADNSEFRVGNIPVKVIHTPGHTKDSITLRFPDRILTGDVLFLDEGGAGRDDLPGGDPAEHWDSLQRILTLPETLVVYPAHDYRGRKPSDMVAQKLHNPHLQPKSREAFVKFVEDLKLGPANWMKDVLKANYACARDPKAVWVPVDVPACEIKGTLNQGVNDQKVSSVTPEELQQKLKSELPLALIDVREAEEFEGELGHLPGAKNIPIASLSARLSELASLKGKEIITICRSGGRAHTAAQILMQAGFEKAFVLQGGMTAWKNLRG
ncbi:MAG TPA: MBL fold metallo-hydrolase, partial [bacterium]|nr:MBL fold metallo-hydrolase [bacterium]